LGAPFSVPRFYLSETAARERVNRIIGLLQDEHPRESAEQLFERFSDLMSSDPSLREAFLLSGFSSICDAARQFAGADRQRNPFLIGHAHHRL